MPIIRLARAWRARATAAAILAGYFGLVWARGGQRAWGRLGVWVLSPSFLDLRSVTTAWVCARRGIAVLPANPCDPLRRPANYPTIWLLPSHLGLGPSSTVALGILTAVLFFLAALAVLPQGAGFGLGCIYGVALCSPAVMLGIDRGNVDLLVFGVVVVGVLALRWRPKIVAPLLMLFAAVLKLFPIAASIVLLRSSDRRARFAFVGVIVGFAVYALATLGTIREIAHVLPQTTIYSYGIKPFGAWARNVFGTYHVHLPNVAWDVLAIGMVILAGLLAQTRVARRLSIEERDRSADFDFFVAGAAVYVATFLLIQSFDYRLVFLLLVVPQLFRWSQRTALGALALVLVLFTLWLGPAWSGVPAVASILHGWHWLTSQRPFFSVDRGVDQPLAADVTAQLLLAAALIILLIAVAPRVRLSRQ